MNLIKQKIFKSGAFAKLESAVARGAPGTTITLHGLAGSLPALVCSFLHESRGLPIVLISSDEERAEKLRDDCALLLGEQRVRYFGARPAHQAEALDLTSSIAQIEALKSLIAGEKNVIIASPKSIVEKVPAPASFKSTTIEIRTAGETDFQQLIRKLEEIGFERKDFVEGYGDFAVRGGILDVFSFVGENPLRMEFWGNSVESIREFDVFSQRSIRNLEIASIVPSFTGHRESESAPASGAGTSNSTLFDYLEQETIIFFDEPELVRAEIESLHNEGITDIFSFEDTLRNARRFPVLHATGFNTSQLTLRPSQFDIGVDFNASSQPSTHGSIGHLVDHLKKLTLDGFTILLASDTKEDARRLQDLIEEVLTSPELSGYHSPEGGERNRDILTASDVKVQYLHETLHSGFIWQEEKVAYFTEHEIFNRLRRRGLAKRRRFKGFSQKELQQLRPGDCVVHVDHGIGRFEGLKKISVSGTEQEVMKLVFLENDILYVNLNFVNRVQKYSSAEGHVPLLSKLGGGDWEKIKSRAKRRIKDIARDLIALYAKRKKEQGFAFAPDTHWQKELEASFMYEDTPDQARSTQEVKQDMESSSPMDRLVCGDVGFGKTEVALRAAFKAVMDGKQVGILVPTTILALQHYNTFRDRLSKYSVRLDHLTRFRSTKEQKLIVEQLASGGGGCHYRYASASFQGYSLQRPWTPGHR